MAGDPSRPAERWFIVGGGGFIGSHFVARLLDSGAQAVTVYDNFTSGRRWYLEEHLGDERLQVVEADVHELDRLTSAMRDHDVVIHLASNPDIARAATEPGVDFHEGTALTFNVVEAMRVSGVRQILYASGSGVYGELGDLEATEDHGPMIPVSTYGASKLAGEALIASYSAMFDLRGCAFRFGNVVGPRQTHGVGLDFLRRLLADPTCLRILGDGKQSKSYIHVQDVIDAVLLAKSANRAGFTPYNVATGDYITVTEIADLAVACLGLPVGSADYQYSGGDRGWRGDVPIVRLNTDRIRDLGWANARTTAEAVRDSLAAMLPDLRGGRL